MLGAFFQGTFLSRSYKDGTSAVLGPPVCSSLGEADWGCWWSVCREGTAGGANCVSGWLLHVQRVESASLTSSRLASPPVLEQLSDLGVEPGRGWTSCPDLLQSLGGVRWSAGPSASPSGWQCTRDVTPCDVRAASAFPSAWQCTRDLTPCDVRAASASPSGWQCTCDLSRCDVRVALAAPSGWQCLRG